MKRFFILCLVALAATISAYSQSAREILDKSAAAIRQAGGVSADFTLSAGGSDHKGKIRLLGSKFYASLQGHETWYNGKTLWTYVKDNDEVNVTTPSQKEIAKINPYAFLSVYKNGYELTKGKSTQKYYEVNMKSKDGKSSIKSAVVRVDKSTCRPLWLKISTLNATHTITVNTFARNQKFDDATFTFSKKAHPTAEIIDLR